MNQISFFNAQGQYLSTGADTFIPPGIEPPPIRMPNGASGFVKRGVDIFNQYHDIVTNITMDKPVAPSGDHEFDWKSKEWFDPRSLQDLKDAKWSQFKLLREAAAVAPLMATRFGVFDAAPKDMASIKDALAGMVAAESLGDFVQPIQWTMADSSPERYVTLTLNELREVAVLLLARGNEAHVYSRGLYEQIEGVKNKAELDMIAWDFNGTTDTPAV